MTGDRDRWEHFAHGADVGVRGLAATRAGAFEQVAAALTAVVIADPAAIRSTVAVPIACQAEDDDELLLDWLNTIVYEMAARRMVFGRFAVTLEGTCLSGSAWGEPVDLPRHEPAVEVKGATYTAARVARDADGRWVAQCVVDV